MDMQTRKNTGSYYTCHSIADYIANWAINNPASCILEPSFGDGSFIDASKNRFAVLGNNNPNIIGIEIQQKPYDSYMNANIGITGFCMDFMDYRETAKIDAVIGNPPYVSLKNLKEADRTKTLKLIKSYGINMQTSGSLWMPFVIHAAELLEENGKLGFVLPYEITYVRYAFELWNYLSSNFGKITICRIFRDFFPDVDVETVVLLAERKGHSTSFIDYNVYETISDLYNNNACHTSKISIQDVVSLQKPFERNLLPDIISEQFKVLRQEHRLTDFVNDCKFKIGYVSGNKGYFHPTEKIIGEYGISVDNVRKALLNAKQLSANLGTGLETINIENYSNLFYPTNIGSGEQSYITYGEIKGINNGYKCKVRKPWYLTPGLEVPDVILTVFGDVPKLLMNNGQFYVSNSLLSGFSKVDNPKELICRWYNSLTLLSIETTIHSLGGGTLVLIPGETDKLEIVSDFPKSKIDSTFDMLSEFAKKNKTEDIYKYGDTIVLKEIYGFSDEIIKNINEALEILRNWRNPEKRRG